MIEARLGGAMQARIVAGHPCRADIDGDELMIGTDPLVAQVGNSRWSGDSAERGTILRKDGTAIVQILAQDTGPGASADPGATPSSESAGQVAGAAPSHASGHAPPHAAGQSPGVDVLDAQGGAILHISGDGAIANARGEILRRAEPDGSAPAAIKVGESVVTGTGDLALAALVTAPELGPEVRALAACYRLFSREQARK